MYQLVITEKPSVAQSIAKVLGAKKRNEGYLSGNGYLVSWCIGHLIGLKTPEGYGDQYKKWKREDLPIIPDVFRWEVLLGKEKQFQVLKELMERNDVDNIICATDAGREGELIFRLVYEQAGCEKVVKRLWISSMEDTAILKGFQNLKDSSAYDALYRAAVSRAVADWLVGINGTRLFSVLYDTRLTVGRVQTPTLAMVVEREKQIEVFEKQKYQNLHLVGKDFTLHKEKIFSKEEADRLQKECQNSNMVITAVKRQVKTVNPPNLYDLTTLQRESNRYFGYTAQKTLDTAQSLYEKKMITYPRTDSQYLTEDMREGLPVIIRTAARLLNWNGEADLSGVLEHLIDDKKVADHHALLPTIEALNIDNKNLSKEEQDLLVLIACKVLCASGTPQKIAETTVEAMCAEETFSARGKIILENGWKSYEDFFREVYLRRVKKEDEKTVLPDVKEGQEITDFKVTMTEHFTSPPKSYTEDSLLSAMETAGNEVFEKETEKKGLGTPATRASMIEKLVESGYLQRKGKQLIATEAGKQLIAILPDKVCSSYLTAEWENTLMEIERGKGSEDAFLSGIKDWVRELVDAHTQITEEERKRFEKTAPKKEAIGMCPRCKNPVYEGEKNYYCSSKACSFCIWKENKWLTGMKKKVSKKMAKDLLSKGRTPVKGFYSAKTGKTFDADLLLCDIGEYVNFKLDFSKNDRKE